MRIGAWSIELSSPRRVRAGRVNANRPAVHDEAASADALTRCLLPAADSVTPRIGSPSDSFKKQPPRESDVAGAA